MKELTNFEVQAVSGGFFATTGGNVGAAIGASVGAAVGSYGVFFLSLADSIFNFNRAGQYTIGVAALTLGGCVAAGVGIGGFIGTSVSALYSGVSNSLGE